jgi:hypothetical protein
MGRMGRGRAGVERVLVGVAAAALLVLPLGLELVERLEEVASARDREGLCA